MTGDRKDLATQGWQTLLDVTFPSQPGQLRVISAQMAQAITPLALPAARQNKLMAALRRAVEHASLPARERPPASQVTICVLAMQEVVAGDVTASLGGWNFFLVEQSVSTHGLGEEPNVTHRIQVFLYQDGQTPQDIAA